MSKNSRENKIRVINSLLDTNIELMKYLKGIATDDESRKVCNKCIRQSKKAKLVLPTIYHDEIINYIFASLFAGKEHYYAISSAIITSKKIENWDKTEDGYNEFLFEQEQAKKEQEQKIKERKEQHELMAKAKAEGKKIEMVFDKASGKIVPVIVDNENA